MNSLDPQTELFKRLAASSAASLLEPLYSKAADALDASGYAGVLRGEGWLSHAAHPVLTDVPIGLLTATSVLDLLGGPKSRRARTILCGLGVLSAVPTAASGLADWNRLEGEDRRLGVIHAAGNGAAIGLYAKSAMLRLAGHHGRGTLCALAGAGVMAAAGYLGGELALNRGAAARHPAPAGGPLPTEHPVPEGAHTPTDGRPAQHSA
ncbi:MAG TPA: DUF2231 domain-containing protein [Nocardioides sp.]|nr:DUF2231 domain-containing protein [Nocardioides sp.]